MATSGDKTRSTGQRQQARSTRAAESTREQQETEAPVVARDGRTATVRLPFVTAQFRAPEVHLPRLSGREISDAAGSVASMLPPPGKLAYYTGLGALAAFEVIEWPVAVAIGAGTAVAQRARSEAERRRDTQPAEGETAAT